MTVADMPAWIAERHHQLNEAARACYELRNTAVADGLIVEAILCEREGDRYFTAALAVNAEWVGARDREGGTWC